MTGLRGPVLSIYTVAIMLVLWTGAATSAFETSTHREINEQAVGASARFREYLANELHFTRGAREPLNGRTVVNWIGDGGVAEDQLLGLETLGGLTRSARHFHTPLLSWDQSGLNLPPLPRFESSVRWAQSDQGIVLGRAAWQDARASFFGAATAATEPERKAKYADTFRILGQVMHLVADAAQPAHTRNGAHVLGDPFEAFLKDGKNVPLITGSASFDAGILQMPTNDVVARVPVAHIWDANRYDGTNPPDDATSSLFGLAEISSANFFSATTIAPLAHEDEVLPLPALDVLDQSFIAPYITGEYRQYLGKSGHGLPVNPLVAEGTFYRFLPPFVVNLGLDDIVLTEYARHLMPRAIGYSAGLLEYFFRGRIEIAPPARFPYGLTRFLPGNAGSFSKLRFKARNATPGEDTGPGYVIAVVQYRTPLAAESIIDNPFTPISSQLSFSVSDPIALTLTPEFQEIGFGFQTPIPANAADVFLTVVYRARLGLEEDAVMVGGKDLFEPAPHDVVNGTDWECVDGRLYHVSDPTAFPPYALPDQRQRDVNDDGRADLFGPDIARGELFKTFDLSGPAPTPSDANFDLSTAAKAPAEFSRVVLLQDQASYGTAILVREIESVPTGGIGRNRLEFHSVPGVVNDIVSAQNGLLVRRVAPSFLYRGVPTYSVLVMLTGDTLDCFADTFSLPPTLTRIEGVIGPE